MIAEIISPSTYNSTFPTYDKDDILRSAFLQTINRLFKEGNNVIFLEGPSGYGKTKILKQFIDLNYENSIGYFVSVIDKYSTTRNCLNNALFSQITYLISHGEIQKDIPDNFILQLRNEIDKKIRYFASKDKFIYFVFDGLQSLNKQSLEVFKEVLEDLPWEKAKFLFSGDSNLLLPILPDKNKLKYKSIQIIPFNKEETTAYFKDITNNKDYIDEIYLISSNGIPEKLSQIKTICNETDIENFLVEFSSGNIDLYEYEWLKVDTELKEEILAVLVFSEIQLDDRQLTQILNINETQLATIIQTLPFLILNENNTRTFKSEYFFKYAKNKLIKRESTVIANLIKFVTNDEVGLDIDLPKLYSRNKQWKEVINYYNFDTFIQLLEKNPSFSLLYEQLDFGFLAAKSGNASFGEYIKFSLPKSSFKSIEKDEAWDSEIQARIALEDVDGAMSLLNNVFLKEDRFRLLALIAKQKKENNLEIEPTIVKEINDLYKTIDPLILKDRAIGIASLLLYSCPELAIDLVEKTTDNSAGTRSLDTAFALLSLTAIGANQKSNSVIADLEKFTSKILNEEQKDLVVAMTHLVKTYNAKEIIEESKKLTTTSRKLFLLNNWVKYNTDFSQILDVISFALDEIVKASSDEAPSATILKDFAQPLYKSPDLKKLAEVIKQFDTQKNTINTPTRDFIKLQLYIATGEMKFDLGKASKRLIEIYYKINEIEDAAIQADCLTLLWLTLNIIDETKEIELKEGIGELAKQELNAIVSVILNNTALHFNVVEYIISFAVEFNTDFVYSLIEKLNTEDRRDNGYKFAITNLLNQQLFNSTNFSFFRKCYDSIVNKDIKQDSLVQVLSYVSSLKERNVELTRDIKTFSKDITEITDSSIRCYAISNFIKIISEDSKISSPLVTSLLELLNNSWQTIDSPWTKIDLGFTLAKALSTFDNTIAKNYLEESLKVKNEHSIDTSATAEAYIMSLLLCIRAFAGLIKKHNNYDNDIFTFEQLLEPLPNGEKIRVWSCLAYRFLLAKTDEYFNKVIKHYILKPLNNLKIGLDQRYYTFVFRNTAAVIYLYNEQLYHEYLEQVCDNEKDSILSETCHVLLKGVPLEDQTDPEYRPNIEYETMLQILHLVKEMENDNMIYGWVNDLVMLVKKNYLVQTQKNAVIHQLNEIVNSKLPNVKSGIKHDGYKLACEILIKSISNSLDKQGIDAIKASIEKIDNASDRALLYNILAKEFKYKSNALRLEVVKEAFNTADKIPVGFDKLTRYEQILPILAETSLAEFQKKVASIVSNLIQGEEEDNYQTHKKLIDLFHQYDPKNVKAYIALLDRDEIRNKKLKNALEKRVEGLERKQSFIDDISTAKKLKLKEELDKYSKNLLMKLNSGMFAAKDPQDFANLLEVASRHSLEDSYNAYSLIIENIVKKYSKKANVDLIRKTFEATVFNAKLVSSLSENSLEKIRSRFTLITQADELQKSIFKAGEKEQFILFLNNWLEENTPSEIYIMDPYFHPKDIEILKVIKESTSKCEVFIITTLKALKGISDYHAAYVSEWKAISIENPPETTIKIVWLEGSDIQPFHDRYMILDLIGLKPGHSFGEVGRLSDSGVTILINRELDEARVVVVTDYYLGKKKEHDNFKIKHTSFSL